MSDYKFRAAIPADQPKIWNIIEAAIQRRKQDGSKQWQDGYPNPEVIQNDIDKEQGYVLLEGDEIIGYTALLINDEPAYAAIEGNWLSNGDFVVIHRVAISERHVGKGLSGKILEAVADVAVSKNIYSIKADTNFDNPGMLRIFEKQGYQYCGEVYFRGSARRAFEKVLKPTT